MRGIDQVEKENKQNAGPTNSWRRRAAGLPTALQIDANFQELNEGADDDDD